MHLSAPELGKGMTGNSSTSMGTLSEYMHVRTCGNDCVVGPDRGLQRLIAVYKMQRVAAEIVESELQCAGGSRAGVHCNHNRFEGSHTIENMEYTTTLLYKRRRNCITPFLKLSTCSHDARTQNFGYVCHTAIFAQAISTFHLANNSFDWTREMTFCQVMSGLLDHQTVCSSAHRSTQQLNMNNGGMCYPHARSFRPATK